MYVYLPIYLNHLLWLPTRLYKKDTALAWLMPTKTATQRMTLDHSPLWLDTVSPRRRSQNGYNKPIATEKESLIKYRCCSITMKNKIQSGARTSDNINAIWNYRDARCSYLLQNQCWEESTIQTRISFQQYPGTHKWHGVELEVDSIQMQTAHQLWIGSTPLRPNWIDVETCWYPCSYTRSLDTVITTLAILEFENCQS